MTVSRKGKRGTRAGATMRPSSRNGRVRGNAAGKNITKQLKHVPSAKMSKEEWVINVATWAVGKRAGRGFVGADDLVSDIILMLLDAGGFSWEEQEIKDFCRKKSQWMIERYMSRREKNECEFSKAGSDGEGGATGERDEINLISLAGAIPARQDMIVDARMWAGRLRAIPDRQRQALEVLCDGGNPIDVAEEMGVTPWEAVTLIKEGREYVWRVDPLDGPPVDQLDRSSGSEPEGRWFESNRAGQA